MIDLINDPAEGNEMDDVSLGMAFSLRIMRVNNGLGIVMSLVVVDRVMAVIQLLRFWC